MGYAILHMEKTNGTDSTMSAHIERTIKPKNADENRTYLNQELISFPDGVTIFGNTFRIRLEKKILFRQSCI